ncbi:hypothetical protein F511_02139 [Dorcoceras hygrometricum]|uniref:Uncharacterized protein n=1 Tax=Dorcoceras hygrometricum TaxID=472368 RepID=A0A2Z7DAC3_9LAMI|nr:hypothetical protein F511_02139 [Dorcoceras hygrometricum]
MSLFDLQDVCIAIGSIETLDLPMVVDLIGIYGLKGMYCTLTTTNWFLQALSVIPRGSWGDVSRRFYHDPLGKSGIVIPEPQCVPPPSPLQKAAAAARRAPPPLFAGKSFPVNLDEENPSAPISSGLLVHADEGIRSPVVDLIDDIYRRLPRDPDPTWLPNIPHLLNVSPNTHPLLLHPDKNEEQEMAPSVPRTRAAAALRMKQIALDNQDRTIRRLRVQLATERRGLVVTKKELEETQVALEASHKVIAGLTEIGLSMSKKIERMKVKKQQVRANHVECHQKFQSRIHEAEDSMQAQHLLIEALVDEKDSLIQTIHGLQEANNAPAPFDGDWEEEPEEEPEEEEIEDIPLGEGEIDDE